MKKTLGFVVIALVVLLGAGEARAGYNEVRVDLGYNAYSSDGSEPNPEDLNFGIQYMRLFELPSSPFFLGAGVRVYFDLGADRYCDSNINRVSESGLGGVRSHIECYEATSEFGGNFFATVGYALSERVRVYSNVGYAFLSIE
ncbi:MAG: hypothetical protein GDA50_07015 [Alphaproteobacteria bacterium GM202ARS2]|nr:hypothetical protein [Alphaproteobacteria bacterium GM202ARS2]